MAGFPAISFASGLSKLNVTVLFDTKEDGYDSDQDGNWEVDSDFGGRMFFPIHHTYNHDDNSDGTCSICRVSP